MAARKFTAEELIAYIRKKGGLPNVTSAGTSDADLVQSIGEEAQWVYSEIAQGREEYFVATDRIAVDPTKTRYRIPHRAQFGKLRSVGGVDTNGNTYPLHEITREIAWKAGSPSVTYPENYYIEGSYLVLSPAASGGWIDMDYLFRPGDLVLSTECRQVATVDTGTGVVTFSSAVPTGWTSSLRYDIHDQYSGASPKAWGISATVAGSAMTFSPADIDGFTRGRFPVEVGDWVCLEETAAILGIPRELHPVVGQRVICQYLERKDPKQYEMATATLEKMIQSARSSMAMRVEGPGIQIDAGGESPFFGA